MLGLLRGKTRAARRRNQSNLSTMILLTRRSLSYQRWVADMVRAQSALTGCRPAEVCINAHAISTARTTSGQYRPRFHKTQHHGRELHLSSSARQLRGSCCHFWPARARCIASGPMTARRRDAAHAKRKAPLSCGNVPGSNRGQTQASSLGRRAVHCRQLPQGCSVCLTMA